ncbi:MAG: hypothetical protein ACRD3Y_04580 [Bryobacteraceae bacterium]
MSPSQSLDEIDRLRAALKAVLERAAELIRPCKRCGEMLYFVRAADGAIAPYTAAGLNHFTSCPHADEFHKKKRAANQEALFDTTPLPD